MKYKGVDMLPKHYNHWADQVAKRVIAQKGDKELYTVATGFAPSGYGHFGHLREIIVHDFIARALMSRGKKVRFIMSIDDFDRFRKVPGNIPNQEKLPEHIGKALTNVPNPFDDIKGENYADVFTQMFRKDLDKVGMKYMEYLFQSEKYQAKTYGKEIKKACDNAMVIKEILDEWRREPLPKNYLPIAIFCEKCKKDLTADYNYDGEKVSYHCEVCGYEGVEKIDSSSNIKLPWKIDWPMRWNWEKVDMEGGGKDHSTQGSSATVCPIIQEKVYGTKAPVYVVYENVNIKGEGKKMSSSGNSLLTISDVLQIYPPEMLRWIFASYKPNTKFDIAFDLDVIKNYEDFDRMERVYYGKEILNEKKTNMLKRLYELSQLDVDGKTAAQIPFRPAFRHLCNFLQINGLDIEATKKHYANEIKNKNDENSFLERAEKAKYWIENYAPAEFKFMLHSVENAKIDSLNNAEKKLIKSLIEYLENEKVLDEKELKNFFYAKIPELEIDAKEFYQKLYMLLIGKNHGPKIAMFLVNIGAEKVLPLLKKNV